MPYRLLAMLALGALITPGPSLAFRFADGSEGFSPRSSVDPRSRTKKRGRFGDLVSQSAAGANSKPNSEAADELAFEAPATRRARELIGILSDADSRTTLTYLEQNVEPQALQRASEARI